ncbi:MAG TPA: alpha/beta fold hydrolase [Candidatus Acidoferrales bacterium]|nr:alpha/beta fold hydrolase [Candidatus Acidoferrales bacterium]
MALLVAGLAFNRLRYDLRSYALLTHFVDPKSDGPLLRYESYLVRTEEVSIPTPNGAVRGRLYLPIGIAHPAGLMAVHGIHHLGIDEPRLMNFCHAVAESGFAVLTPQLDALADYHVDDASIVTIGESAAWFDQRLGGRRVMVTGVSFAGGLSLLAARNPTYASHMRALVLMGAYDDLARVSRFLATSEEELPDGRSIPFPAHDYGASVFVYAHLDQFFPAADLSAAHEALRDWLWEQPDKAEQALAQLSPASRATMEALLARRIDVVRERILGAIQADRAELAALSPHGQISDLRVPVFILHGADDNVIPPAESRWLEREVPDSQLREVLITTAFSHVDPKKQPGLYEELRLVHFLGAVLREMG